MSGLRGFVQGFAALIIGGLIGFSIAWMIAQSAQIKTTSELYLSDTGSINMLYHGRNMEEYLRVSEEDIVKNFIESGGPEYCGTVEVDGHLISVWKSADCEITYSQDVSTNYSGKLAMDSSRRYASSWGVSVSSEGESFCFHQRDLLPFGEYTSEVCFDSPLTEAIDNSFNDMDQTYQAGSVDCSCLNEDSICWADVNSYNFTYALKGDCS